MQSDMCATGYQISLIHKNHAAYEINGGSKYAEFSIILIWGDRATHAIPQRQESLRTTFPLNLSLCQNDV